MSDGKIFGIDGEKSLSILEDLHGVCQRHGFKETVALMVGYSALLIPRNIYCEGWRPEAIDHAAEVLRTIANDRMAEIEADNGQVKEPWETHDYIH